MATIKKQQQHPLNSMHTAGIFSDMSIDGPEIGTLVMVVDKAKNLPNRKTIGKQDPYCAARLGKEAKKTTTDVRGGQTPKWDQELRFTVHDCADYYQLKVSVFNDDKKTDLIGETWIDLRNIVIPGGGQSDTWHTLNYRSKYAGEIRLEITYYDSRPKPEKPAAKPKPVTSATDSSASGQQAAPKRRPLPSEPPNGPTPPPAPVQEHVQTPPRVQPKTPPAFVPKQSPLQNLEYNTPSSSARHHQKSHHHSPAAPPPPSGYNNSPQPHHHQGHHHRVSDRHEKYAVRPEELDFVGGDDRSQYSSSYPQAHSQAYDRQEPRGSFDADRDPYDQRGMSPMDSQRQPPDEDRPPPPPAHRSRGGSGTAIDLAYRGGSLDAGQRGTPPTMRQDVLRSAAHRQSMGSSSYPGRPTYRPYDSAPAPPNGPQYPEEAAHQPPQPRHHSYDSAYDPQYRSMQPTVEDDPDSPGAVVTSYRQSTSRAPQPHYNDVEYDPMSAPAPLNLGGRNNVSGQHSPSPVGLPQSHHGRNYSNGYSHDVSVSPGAPRSNSYGGNPDPMSSRDGYARDHHQRSPSPNPMPNHRQISPGPSPRRDHLPVSPVAGPSSSRDHYQSSPSANAHSGYSTTASHRQIEYQPDRDELHVNPQHSSGYAVVPAVPASLVPGVDPSLALELSARINEDRRQERRQNSVVTTPTRGRQMIEYDYGHDASRQQFVGTPPQHQSYEQRGHGYQHVGTPSSAVGASGGHRRSVSPNPMTPQQQHTIRRKSISPAPPVDSRRLSGIPFAPDSFDELNPKVAAATAQEKLKVRPDYNEASGKIISHDGREIDPSDHLPMETWAPEPEPKPPKPASGQGDSRTSGSGMSPAAGGGGGLPIGPSGRRQLRIAAARPQSMSPVTYGNGNASASTNSLPMYGNGDMSPSHAVAAGRNRLQKKVQHHRGSSATATMGSSPLGGSSPLAPIPQPHNYQDGHTPPRAPQRASTFDYNQSENHAPLVLYNGAGGGRSGHSSSVPPIPAKIPMGGGHAHSPSAYRGDPGMPVMSGALPAPGPPSFGGGGGGGADWALIEEMRSIDIGTGRARRHGGGY